MKGFLISNEMELATIEANNYSFGKNIFFLEHQNCQLYFDEDKKQLLILDGYLINITLNELFKYISNKQFDKLTTIDGHFCGVYIDEHQKVGFNDRYGGNTLYWRTDLPFTIASQLVSLPITKAQFNEKALCDNLTYRWNLSEQTLIENVHQLKVRHYIDFTEVSQQHQYWELPAPKYTNTPLEQKIADTKQALIVSLEKAAKKYTKVAVFLSGGVDSSILAALSKEVFEHCVLITPVFKGEENPELDTALAFTKKLNLEHILVEIDVEQLQPDLLLLTKLKRAPLRHYSSLAMMAMMKAVPKECQAVIYGEAADTLFGTNTVKRFTTYVGWKRKTAWFPSIFIRCFKSVITHKVKLLLSLKSKSYFELVEALTSIKYSSNELKLIETFNYKKAPPIDYSYIKYMDKPSLRYFAQENIISSDIAMHFQEAELIARLYDKAIISPFFDPEILALSASITDQNFYGETFAKPILRELACQYFPRELIYQRKYGFPVPYIAWLKSPLKSMISKAYQETELFDGKILKSLNIEECYETYWMAINLMLVRDHLSSELSSS